MFNFTTQIETFINSTLPACGNSRSNSLISVSLWSMNTVCCFSPEFQLRKSCNILVKCPRGLNDQTDRVLISTKLQDS